MLIHGKGKVVKALQTEARKVDNIYLAADPDREGEAICWHLAEELKKTKKPIYRITYNEVTKSAILEAIQAPGEINMALVDAQQAATRFWTDSSDTRLVLFCGVASNRG